MSNQKGKANSDRASKMAAKLMQNLIMGGEDPAVVYMVFSIGGAICAHVHEEKREEYLINCGQFYDESNNFIKNLGGANEKH